MLREQLALCEARAVKTETENVNLKAQIATLTAELKLTQQALGDEKQQHERLKKEHEEEVRVWDTVELRRGKRTFNLWRPFCPRCHMPFLLDNRFTVECSGKCGFISDMRKNEVVKIMNDLEAISKAESM